LQIVQASARWDIPQCEQNIGKYLELVRAEIKKAHEVLRIINNWDKHAGNGSSLYNAAQAAQKIEITKGTIRNWERNGLLNREFDKYERRLYTEGDIQRMKLINMLRKVGYSLNILLNFFTAFDKGDPQAIKVLIDPDENEDLNEVCDRWLQKLLAAEGYGLEMLELIYSNTSSTML